MPIRNLAFFALIAVSAFFVGCSEDSSITGPSSEIESVNAARVAKDARPSITTIADIAIEFSNAENPEFTILVAALQAADPKILAKLDGRGQNTVFAPTDAAFAALFANPDFPLTAEELLADTQLLSTVLLYHVSPGRRMSGDVLSAERIRMRAAGFTFPFIEGENAYLGDTSDLSADARLLAQEGLIDIEADNGVIHVIDQVLLP